MSPRSLAPGLVVALALAPLAFVLDRGRAAGLPLGAVDALAVVYFALVVAAPLALQPLGLARGASLAARTLASILPSAAWWLSEVAFRLQWHGPLEAVYLNLSLPNLLHAQLTLLLVVVGELLGRALVREAPRVWTRRTLAALGGALALFAADAGLGLRYYLGFQELWRAVFAPPDPWTPDALPGPLAPGPAEPAAERPPNVVVILSDDHRHDFASHAGHAFVRTPALDRLAAEGVRFSNAFVTSSLCSPSRGTFLTGTQPARHGVRNNYTAWDDRNRTFLEYLASAGYRTAFIGKWHMPGGLPHLRGVEHFTTFTVMGGQGVYRDCPLVVDGRPEPSRKHYIAEELTDRAIAWIEQASRDPATPFALYLAHKNVHSEFRPDPREAGRHARAPVALPTAAPHSFFAMTDGQYAHLMPLPIQRIVRRYGEAVESMDREIGRLLDRLDALGLTDDTLVVYTSDNGFLFGEHASFDKRWAWEDSIRVPFLLRHPGHVEAGREEPRLVTNLDLAPTLVALAGLPVPDEMEGGDLRAMLRDPAAPWRRDFHYAYDFEPPFPVPRIEALRTERYKYVEAQGEAPRLYDVIADPEERDDRVARGDHGPLVARLAARLAEAREARNR